jgi:hypothetical protein
VDRRSQLEALGLSPGLIALATQQYSHLAFGFRCEEPYRCYSVPAEYWPVDFAPLWECTETVVGCRRTPSGLEFVDWYLEAGDPPKLIARSEQGLLFWLFSYLIEDHDWDDEPAARRELAEAAAAVGFRQLAEVEKFQEKFGRRRDYAELLQVAAEQIPAEQKVAADGGRDPGS